MDDRYDAKTMFYRIKLIELALKAKRAEDLSVICTFAQTLLRQSATITK